MGVRSWLANKLIGWGIGLGRKAGYEEAVVLSDHSINVEMQQPDGTERAWDSSLYRHGNVFVDGYANPIKPTVDYNEELEEPDTIDVEEGDGDASEDADGPHVELISSPRYRDYMRQDLISQLLNPREQWRLIAYGIIAVAALVFVNIIVVLYATGSF